MSRSIRRLLATAVVALAPAVALPSSAAAQFQQRDEQFYYPGGFNWQFLKRYPEAARLFNAFDYGHAVLYETLYTTRDEATRRKLEREYEYLTTNLLVRPPRFAVVEEVVEPRYAKLAWRAKLMFDWAHVLHRQIYDIYADPELSPARRDSLIERVTDYYLSKKEYAFTTAPKSMALMDEQYYSQSFRKAHPKFNGLIWAYHWLQVGLYEPFLEGSTPDETKAGVQATLARFWSMLEDAPARLPSVMPMTSAVAPRFSAAHPRAAVIFDNLHMMHDIISDILQNDTVPAAKKGEIINLALDEFQDSTKNVISMEMWRNMADHMGGVAAMGGPATGILRPIQASAARPTAPATGHAPAGQGAGGHSGHAPATPAAPDARARAAPAAREHEGGHEGGHEAGHHPTGPSRATEGREPGSDHRSRMMQLHMRMMRDSVIRQRVQADTAMRRLMDEMMTEMPAEHREHMRGMMDQAPARSEAPREPSRQVAPEPSKPARRPRPDTRPAPTPSAPKPEPAPRPAADTAAAHEGHHPS